MRPAKLTSAPTLQPRGDGVECHDCILRNTDKRDVLQIILETLAFDNLADQLVESMTRGLNAFRAQDLVIDSEPLSSAGPMGEPSIG
jgi:hypothetical protein